MSLIKTKTFWGGLAAIATGVGLLFVGNIPEGIQTIAGGVLAIFIRDGIRKGQ
ncbi:MAG TPA: hypothetical protein VM118_09025 [Acidobacteriota bacterium]|nr:hypothetical protein [Acidobacteriota bacterium]